MNREIKFRAWDGEKMLDNPQFEFFLHGRAGRTVMMANSSENVDIMQFTGLKDKHGKEIYEGDIVRYWYLADSYNQKGKLVYCDVVIEWKIAEDRGEYDSYQEGFCGFSTQFNRVDEYTGKQEEGEYFEVIGNIHENQLMKGESL